MSEIKLNSDYITLINHLKEKVKSAQLKAALSVNQAVIELYWYIGKKIIEKQQQVNWGSKLIESMAHDLQSAFPETHGFSLANLKRMKRFAEEYPDFEISAQTVRQLPWGHIVLLIQKIKLPQEREWYASKQGDSRKIKIQLANHSGN